MLTQQCQSFIISVAPHSWRITTQLVRLHLLSDLTALFVTLIALFCSFSLVIYPLSLSSKSHKTGWSRMFWDFIVSSLLLSDPHELCVRVMFCVVCRFYLSARLSVCFELVSLVTYLVTHLFYVLLFMPLWIYSLGFGSVFVRSRQCIIGCPVPVFLKYIQSYFLTTAAI